MLFSFLGILSVDTVITNTARKQSRQTILPRTAEKMMKPLTLAEMRGELLGIIIFLLDPLDRYFI